MELAGVDPEKVFASREINKDEWVGARVATPVGEGTIIRSIIHPRGKIMYDVKWDEPTKPVFFRGNNTDWEQPESLAEEDVQRFYGDELYSLVVQQHEKEASTKKASGQAELGFESKKESVMSIDPLDALLDKIILGEDVTLDEITTTASVPGYEVPLGAVPAGRKTRKDAKNKCVGCGKEFPFSRGNAGMPLCGKCLDKGKQESVESNDSSPLSECINSGRLYIAPQEDSTPEKPLGSYVDLNAPLPASILFGGKSSILGSNKEFIDPNAFVEGQVIGVVENVDTKQLDEILKNMQDARSIWHVYRPSGYTKKSVGATADPKVVSPDPVANSDSDKAQSPELSQLPEKVDPKDTANIVYFRPSGNSMSDIISMQAVGLAGKYFQLLDDLERCDEGALQNRLSLQEALSLLTFLGKEPAEIEKFRDAAIKRIFKEGYATYVMVEQLMELAKGKLVVEGEEEGDTGTAVADEVDVDDDDSPVGWGTRWDSDRPMPPLTPEQRQLVIDNRDLATDIATFNQYKGRGVAYTPDEVLSDAYFGLVKVAQRFDPSLGKSFRNYATSAIHNELVLWAGEA